MERQQSTGMTGIRIKGKSQHVMSHDKGWCVVDEANQQVMQFFDTKEDALRYAQQTALLAEGEVLIHEPSEQPVTLPTVSLPQREVIPESAVAYPSSGAEGKDDSREEVLPLPELGNITF
jgi:hypothetical protein